MISKFKEKYGLFFSLGRIAVCVVIAAVSVVLDQWSKEWAIRTLKFQPIRTYFNEMVVFRYAENTGAWGSMGSDLHEPLRTILLTLLPILFLTGLFIYVLFKKELKLYEIICYSLIVGGGAGNLIDRAIHGFVVDFLWVGTKSIGTNIFNIADVTIMTGVIALFLIQLIFRPTPKPAA